MFQFAASLVTNRTDLDSYRCFVPLLIVTVLLMAPRDAGAACNVIPGVSKNLRGSVGSLDRPHAGPGDVVEVTLSPLCDGDVPTFGDLVEDLVVTVFFIPPGGPPSAVTLATDCSSLRPQLAQCMALTGGTSCVEIDPGAAVPSISLEGDKKLRFVFPDTDELVGTDTDDLTLAGPARIVVSLANSPLPCAAATADCTAAPQGLACIDSLFAANGSCDDSPHELFGSFTALPPENNFQALCFDPVPPCAPGASQLRMTTDAEGNLLLSMDWSGVLPSPLLRAGRLLSGALAIPAFPDDPAPIRIPSNDFLQSLSPEGSLLPPVFDPRTDGSVSDASIVFGTVDAARTVLRILRRAPGCAGDECDPIFDFASRYHLGFGPILVRRLLEQDTGDLATSGSAGLEQGICQAGVASGAPCTSDAQCAGSRCVGFQMTAGFPVAIDGLTLSDEALVVVLDEGVDGRDVNGDEDADDDVVLLFDRSTGEVQALGEEAESGRAVVRVSQGPFRLPALATDGGVLAILESEPAQGAPGNRDKNQDGDEFDSILRVYEIGGNSVDLSKSIAVDAAPIVDGRSVVVSEGRVFVRTSERAACRSDDVHIVSTDPDLNPTGGAGLPSISANGRYVAFVSLSEAIAADVETPFWGGVFVRDRDVGGDGTFDEAGDVANILINRGLNREPANCFSVDPVLSETGRFVVFQSLASNLAVGDVNCAENSCQVFEKCVALCLDEDCRNECSVDWDTREGACGWDVFLHDRDFDGDGIFDEPDSVYTELVSVDENGEQFGSTRVSDGLSFVSSDGRSVAFGTLKNARVWNYDVDASEILNRDQNFEVTRSAVRPPALSADGKVAVFQAVDELMTPNDTSGPNSGNGLALYVRERDPDGDGEFNDRTAANERLTLDPSGRRVPTGGIFPVLSRDGRFVAFADHGSLHVAGDTNNDFDVFVRDRGEGVTRRVSVGSGGEQASGLSDRPSISADGRFVVFETNSTALLPSDSPGVGGVFIHDSLTGMTALVSKTSSFSFADVLGSTDHITPTISADGDFVVFESKVQAVLGPDGDESVQVFVHGCDQIQGSDVDHSGDGDFNDTVLYVVDTGNHETRILGPAGIVSVANGGASYLVPEGPAGSVANLEATGSFNGGVVHRFVGGEDVSLELIATDVSMSSEWIAVIDGDGFVRVHGVEAMLAPESWVNVEMRADVIEASGPFVAFIAEERSETSSEDLNGDDDVEDRVLQLYDAERDAPLSIGGGFAVEDFVFGPKFCWATGCPCASEADCGDEDRCAPTLLAYRVSEASQGGKPLNDDGDVEDDVLYVYDLEARQVVPSGQAIVPCRFEACDPRVPYRVGRDTVTFLTLESDQNEDLTGDGPPHNDLVIQTLNVRFEPSQAAGSRAGATASPLRTLNDGDGIIARSVSTIGVVRTGVCLESGTTCTSSEDCTSGQCTVPPGRCAVDRGAVCDLNRDGSGTPRSCGEGEVCGELPGASPSCHELLADSESGRSSLCATSQDCRGHPGCVGAGDCICTADPSVSVTLVGPLTGSGGESVFASPAGRCLQSLGRECPCGDGEVCRPDGVCGLPAATCRSDQDCLSLPSAICASSLVTVVVPDTDGDEIPDAFDNCPFVPNPNQRGSLGVGDACRGSAAQLGAYRFGQSAGPRDFAGNQCPDLEAPTVTPTVSATPTSTETATPAPTDTVLPAPSATGTATPTVRGTPPSTDRPTPEPVCAGDCDGDGMVAISELIVGVRIALGLAEVTRCQSFDVDGSLDVSIAELIAAVNNALGGCTR